MIVTYLLYSFKFLLWITLLELKGIPASIRRNPLFHNYAKPALIFLFCILGEICVFETDKARWKLHVSGISLWTIWKNDSRSWRSQEVMNYWLTAEIFFSNSIINRIRLNMDYELLDSQIAFPKVNSVQEACTKCFAVGLLKFEILQTTWRNKAKNIKMLNLLVKNWKVRVWCSLFHFFFSCDLIDFKF